MTGKCNIVFGFFFLLLTASLGPVMVGNLPAIADAGADKQKAVGSLQLSADSEFENTETLEPMTGIELAKANSTALLALNKQLNAQVPNTVIKGGPHAHGNLEALLNIAVGVVLLMLSIGLRFKQLISTIFIVGTLLHSGMMYLAIIFEQAWAGTVLGTGIGPVLILIGLLLAAIASGVGIKKGATA